MFGNVTWEQTAVYNIDPKSGSKLEGGADIEHHFIVAGSPNVWIQRRKDRINESIQEYVEYSACRCCDC